MKKFYMTLVAMFVAVAASAQVYVGGNVGIVSTDNGDDDDVTTYKFLPEIGYNLNQDWAIGASFGWAKGSLTLTMKHIQLTLSRLILTFVTHSSTIRL